MQRMSCAEILASKVMAGGMITKDEAMKLYGEPLEELCAEADEIRKHFCGDKFDVCTIINGKSGRCSEDCKFCAQSADTAPTLTLTRFFHPASSRRRPDAISRLEPRITAS